MQTTGVPAAETDADRTRPRPRPGEARRAASRVIEAWAADRCPGATDEELQRLAREVVRAVRRAVTPRVVPPAHDGLTSKPGADAEAARRIAARLEAELRPAPPRPSVPAPRPAPLRRPLPQQLRAYR
ncbi:hypothetical protein [Peterkaempfera sp. SMS 1(5)a]|uniref:hypothetical protein n=1 Tax=Peterkaempfera podocarpi TaxID=3232308 RepID=UPI00367110ED